MQDITTLLAQGETTLAKAMNAGRATAHRYIPEGNRFSADIDTADLNELWAILATTGNLISGGLPEDFRNSFFALAEMKSFSAWINSARLYSSSDTATYTQAYLNHVAEMAEDMASHLDSAQQHLAHLAA